MKHQLGMDDLNWLATLYIVFFELFLNNKLQSFIVIDM